ncbi:MAG: ABC transporter permease [Bacilli bacterium]
MFKKKKKDINVDVYRGPWKELWYRLKKNRMAMFSLLILLVFVTVALIAQLASMSMFEKFFNDTIFDYDRAIDQNLSNSLQLPSSEHFLGTDPFGRDILTRLIYGTRISLIIGISSVTISVLLGGFFGAITGFYGGRLDNMIMRVMDVFLAVPSILLAIAIVSSLGSAIPFLIFAIALPSVPSFSRITRAAVMSVRDQEFVEASVAVGATDFRIILRHIIPNCMAPIIVQSTLSIAGAILSTAGLSFIGLGIQAPTPEWGNMLSEGRQFIVTSPYYSMITGATIVVVILALNILGDGLRDALDPKLKN